MTAIPFDAFAFTHSLVDAGIPDKQADSIAQAFNKAIQESNAAIIEQVKHDYRLEDITTNKDLDARIRETELKIDARIKETELKIELVRADLQRDIESVRKEIETSKNELIKWFIGTAFAIASIGFMLARFFEHGLI